MKRGVFFSPLLSLHSLAPRTNSIHVTSNNTTRAHTHKHHGNQEVLPIFFGMKSIISTNNAAHSFVRIFFFLFRQIFPIFFLVLVISWILYTILVHTRRMPECLNAQCSSSCTIKYTFFACLFLFAFPHCDVSPRLRCQHTRSAHRTYM